MALDIATPSGTDLPGMGEPGDLLADELFGEEYEKQFRPSLSDRLQIGFLRSDHATQTIESEIPQIKTLTSTVQTLVTGMETIKKDLHYSKEVIKAKYNKDLEEMANSYHMKLQAKIGEMTALHEERVEVVRRSFKQQFQDALVKMAIKYKKYYDDKLGGKLQAAKPSSDKKNKMKTLEAEVQRCQSVIEMLEIQLEQVRAELASKPDVTEIVMDTAELDEALAQNETLQAEISQLTTRIDDLNDAVEFREDRIRDLNIELSASKEETEKEREMTRKLARKVEDLKKEQEKNQDAWKKEVDKMKATLAEDMAGEMKKQMEAQKAALLDKERAAKDAELMQQKLLDDERMKYEKMLAKERENTERARREAQDNKSTELLLQQQSSEVSMLRSRLLRSQRQWEKKFSILRSSLHALKDESYVRQQLQKQAASLKYASISYGTNPITPQASIAAVPSAHGSLNPNKPLPAIPADSEHRIATNTLPSGPGTEVFTTGHADSADDPELDDYVDGFVPLPDPPQWQQRPQFGEYMPSLEQNGTSY